MNDDSLSKIIELVALLCHDLHKDRITMLAGKLSGPTLGSLTVWQECLSSKGIAADHLYALYEAATNSNMKPDTLRGMLLGASKAIEYTTSLQKIELIWTGPSTPFAPTRRTEQALLQLITGARNTLFITSFVAYKVESLITALQRALALEVRVSILIEESELEGGSLSFDSIALMKEQLRGALFYTWEPATQEFIGGKVHAKVAVCDRRLAFISSANLTGYAMEKNMEAGVFIQGGDVPAQLEDHLDGLVNMRVITLR